MVVYTINHVDYSLLLKDIAAQFNIPFSGGNLLIIPPRIGAGYLKILQLQNGLQVMLIDILINKPFGTIRKQANQYAFILHFDDCTIKGAANYLIDEEALQKKDTRISVARLTCNMYQNTEQLPPMVQMKSIKILFDENWLKKYLGLSANTSVIKTYLSLKTASFDIDPLNAGYLNLMEQIWNVPIKDPLQDIYLQNRITLLIERFFTRLHSKSNLLQNQQNLTDDEVKRLLKIEKILCRDFAISPPTIDELCKMVSMCKTKLKNNFKQVYGMSINTYYQQLRMKKAKEYLDEHKFTIKQTSKAVGYQNAANFLMAFQKQFLVMPSELKK